MLMEMFVIILSLALKMMSFLEELKQKKKIQNKKPETRLVCFMRRYLFIALKSVTAFIHRHLWAIRLSSTPKCVGMFQYNFPIFATTVTYWQMMKNDTEIPRLYETCLVRARNREDIGSQGNDENFLMIIYWVFVGYFNIFFLLMVLPKKAWQHETLTIDFFYSSKILYFWPYLLNEKKILRWISEKCFATFQYNFSSSSFATLLSDADILKCLVERHWESYF